jgi:hypothetical protein
MAKSPRPLPAHQLGQIVDTPIGFDDLPKSKPRPVVIIAITGRHALVRGFYTNPNRFHHTLVYKTSINGLDRHSHLADRTHTIRLADITNLRGYLDDHIDPYGDFSNAA